MPTEVALAVMIESVVHKNVERLKQEQTTLRADKKRITAELRNATKTKSRLKKRAKMLSDNDLLEVIQLRRIAKTAQAVAEDAGQDTVSTPPAKKTRGESR